MLKTVGKTAIVLLFCLLLVVSCKAPTEDNDNQTLAFLWKVSSNTNTVYILGSIHVGQADIYPLAETIENAYEASDYLVVEVNTNAISEAEIATLLIGKGMYPNGETLRDNISEDLYSRLSDRLMELDPSGILLDSMNMFEPWVVAITIDDLDYIELGYEAEYGIDFHFMEKAETDDKDILELESVDFQINIFDSMSYEIQIAMLEDAVDNPVTENDLKNMFEAWSIGDTEEIEQLVFDDIEEDEYYRELLYILFDERNLLMVNKIERYLQDDQTYFVVVGAAHLVGENGIINLLTGEGYTVEQR